MSTLKVIGYGRLVENAQPIFLKNFNFNAFKPKDVENWSREQVEIFRLDEEKKIVICSSASTFELAVFSLSDFTSIIFCERFNGILFPPYLSEQGRKDYLYSLFNEGVFENSEHYNSYRSFVIPLIIEDSLRIKKFDDHSFFLNYPPARQTIS